MEEIWKNYDENYEVSNLGRVRNFYDKTIKKQRKHKFGYMYVMLFYGKPKSKSVHRMVAETFIENPKHLREVDHINANKADNRVENLRWVSSTDNKLLAIDKGLWKSNERHWFGPRKPIIAIDLETGKEQEFISLNQAEKVFGKHIVDVLKGRRSQTHGHFFKYKGGDVDAKC